MLCPAWHRQIFSHVWLWWLPAFLPTAALMMSDDALSDPMGSDRNVAESRALMKRMEVLFRNDYDGRWEKVDKTFRQTTRVDIQKGFDAGNYGVGGDFFLFLWFEYREIELWNEWEHYQKRLLAFPEGHPVGQDCGAPICMKATSMS